MEIIRYRFPLVVVDHPLLVALYSRLMVMRIPLARVMHSECRPPFYRVNRYRCGSIGTVSPSRWTRRVKWLANSSFYLSRN